MQVVAACYCLPDGGKLNGELGSWAAPTADDSHGGSGGSGGEGGKSSASLSSFERYDWNSFCVCGQKTFFLALLACNLQLNIESCP